MVFALLFLSQKTPFSHWDYFFGRKTQFLLREEKLIKKNSRKIKFIKIFFIKKIQITFKIFIKINFILFFNNISCNLIILKYPFYIEKERSIFRSFFQKKC
jgi:hypothetical protein